MLLCNLKKRTDGLSFISFCSVLILLATYTPSYGQLTVSPFQTAATLSAAIGGPGITITAPVLTCAGQGNATFTVSPGTALGTSGTLFGISSGIFLGTGKAISAAGSEPTTASTNNGTAGDPALAALALTGSVYDGCSLEFDVTPVGTSLSFNYIFGSEEYNHSTCGPYNDAFGFFISGPGITGTQNMALVPGTSIPVTVNSVNSGIPGTGYSLANCTAMGAGSPFTGYFTDNTGGSNFTYKGFTTELAATHTVVPCNTYHLKLSITDAGNALYDSGVFIEAGSLTVPTVAPQSTCVGGTATYTAPVAGGTWTSSNTAIATIGSLTGIATGVATGTATITYGTSPTCFLTTVITVNALAPILGSTAICAGSATILSNTSGAGTWTSSITTVGTVDAATGVVTGLTGGTTTISFTNAAGCSTSTDVTVTAVAAVTGTTIICIGATTAFSDATADGSWGSSNTAVATITAAGVATGVAGGTSAITYTVPAGCFATAVLTVNAFLTNSFNASICQGGSYDFAGTTYSVTGTYPHTFSTATCDSIVTLHLTVNPLYNTTINQTICSGTAYTFGGVNYTDSGTYVYPSTSIYGCDSIVTLHLAVTPLPLAPTVTSPVNYCLGQTPSALSAGGSNLAWYNTVTGGTGSSPLVPSTAAAGTTWYYVSQTVNGCEGPRDSIAVVVVQYPTVAITATRTTLCQYDTASFSTTPTAGAIYSWSAVGTDITGSATDASVLMQFDSLGTTTVVLTAVENGLCSATDSITVNVIPSPVVSFHVYPDICLGDTVTVALSSVSSGITSFAWNFGDAEVITSTESGGPYNVTWNATGIHIITLAASAGGCTSRPVADSVDVHPLPNAKFTNLSTLDICIGDSVMFSANEKISNYYYHWSPDRFFHNLGDDNIYGIIDNPGYVKLDVKTDFGCRAEDSLLVSAKSCCDLVLPTAFTPNGDGLNDIYRPVSAGHHAIHIFLIKNRWGQTVYESANSREGWDGTFNGVPQDLGTYFYYLKYDCNGKEITEKGEVELIR